MNGKKAKELRRLAEEICIANGIHLSEGYGQYKQARNRMSWEAQYDELGFPLRDPDGDKLMSWQKTPGSIITAWKQRAIYQNLKRKYKREGNQLIKGVMGAIQN